MNTLSKAFALILTILLLYFFPISEAYERQDDISYMVALRTVTEFTDSVRNKGYITPTMYNDFFNQLQTTGNTFDVKMEHYHKKYTPVYTDPTDPLTFQKKITVDYDGFYTPQIMKRLFPDDGKAIDDVNRRYTMSTGDFFKVTVVNTNRTNATLIRDFLNNGNTATEKIVIPYGGMVENEDY
jgi:hypothetical protein